MSSNQENTNRLIEIISSEFGELEPNSIGPESVYKDVIEWNSINSVVLSVVIEAEFGVLLDKEDYTNTETVSDLLNRILTKSLH